MFLNILHQLNLWPRPPRRDWRVALYDPDGMPSGEMYPLSIEEAAELVSWLRQRAGQVPGDPLPRFHHSPPHPALEAARCSKRCRS